MRQALLLICLALLLVPGHVKAVMDGDSFKVYSIGIPAEERIRLLGIDAPERGRPQFAESRAFTAHWLSLGPFTLTTCKRDSFGRLLGTVTRDGHDLGGALISAGLAVGYVR